MTNPIKTINPRLTPQEDDYTVDELVAMPDEEFKEAVTEDLLFTSSWSGPFMDSRVSQRTLHHLYERIWFADSILARVADDPNYPAERWQKTQGFKRHLIACAESVQRRVDWQLGTRSRDVSAWKTLLHQVLDHVEGSARDAILDQLEIPFHKMTLRNWLVARRVKDPGRLKPQEHVGRAA